MFKLLQSVLSPFPTIIPICVTACLGEWILDFSLVLNLSYCLVYLHVLSLIACFGYFFMFTWLKSLDKIIWIWETGVFLFILLWVCNSKNKTSYVSLCGKETHPTLVYAPLQNRFYSVIPTFVFPWIYFCNLT